MNNKRISIIIPTYNSSIILEENIKIISSYKQCKIFVIDDGSVSDEARKNKIICNNYGCN
ncbi:glycosyltransferase family 2 protein, partial [Escherichia coli]